MRVNRQGRGEAPEESAAGESPAAGGVGVSPTNVSGGWVGRTTPAKRSQMHYLAEGRSW